MFYSLLISFGILLPAFSFANQGSNQDPLLKVEKLAVSKHSCALLEKGNLYCWGENQYGQTNVPRINNKIVEVAVGYEHSCGLTEAKKVKCWGSDLWKQSDVPNDLTDVTQIATGFDTCALVKKQGQSSVRCWGYLTSPKNLINPTYVTVGGGHACALTENGLKCWGNNKYGQASVPADLARGEISISR